MLLLVWCGTGGACGGRQNQQPRERSASGGGVTVVQGSELSAGNLLDALRTRVPTMAVSTRSGECPRIVFRGVRSQNQGNPSVYVDGTRMLDTCVLTQIPAADVDYVEVHPSSASSPPGIQRNPFGLILVYRLRQ